MIETILPNLHKIEIPLPKNPLKSVNSYVLTGEERTLIIDTGMNRKECLDAIMAGLARVKVNLAKTDFVITHLHVDHAGLVSTLAEPECKVYASRQDGAAINAYSGPISSQHWQPMREYAARNGFPPELLSFALERHPGNLYRPDRRISITPLEEKDWIHAAGYSFQCIVTPGHTKGHICLYEPEKRILISGDHVLGDITPNISQSQEGADALSAYFASLDKVYRLEVDLVLPAHRRIFTDCRGRIDELRAHHRARLAEVKEILAKNGPLSAYQVASKMTWSIRGSWQEFPVPQKWFAHGEAVAHLAYLAKQGQIVRQCGAGDIVRWTVVNSRRNYDQAGFGGAL